MGVSFSKPAKLVVFDVEGVIIPKNRFIFEIGKSLGPLKLLKVLFFGFLYGINVLRLESALRHIFRMMRGMRKEKLLEIVGKIPMIPNAKETIHQLKSQGSKIAIISSGLPGIVVAGLAKEVGADYAFGFETGVENDTLNGEIWGDVIEQGGKYRILSQILDAEKTSLTNCVVVADDRNNAPMFKSSMLKIGYNPDFIIRIKADQVITGNLSKILAIIKGQPPERALPSTNDLLRETIHSSAIFIPVLSMFVGLSVVALLICIVVALYAVSELSRMEGKNLPLVSQITYRAASQTELYEFAAAPIYFAVGILFALVLFPTPANSAAIAIFAIGDSSASVFGRLSKTVLPINKGKSVGGSVAGIFFAFLAGALFITPWKALVGALVAMTVEVLPLPINDNILIPVFAGLTLTYLL